MKNKVIIVIFFCFLLLFSSHTIWLVKTANHISFKLDVFVIVLILGSLLCYKISSYLSDFKISKQASRLDIIFLLIFFVFLFIPMMHIDKHKKSRYENRVFAKKPVFINHSKINYNFGKEYNDYFNDRFLLRRELYDLYVILRYNLNSVYQDKHSYINKKDKFCFYSGELYAKVYNRSNIFTNEELAKIKNNIISLNNHCKKRNIQLYIFIEPVKENIYSEYYPKGFTRLKNTSQYEQFLNILKDTDVNLISSYDEILKLKNQNIPVFMKTDTHSSRPDQTSYAAFTTYSYLISKIKEKNNNIKSIELKDCTKKTKVQTGHLAYYNHYLSKKLEEPIDLYSIKDKKAKIILNKNYKNGLYKDGKMSVIKFKNNTAENNLYAIILGDSFSRRYHLFLAESFKEFATLYSSKSFIFVLSDEVIKDVFNKKPDILILQATESQLDRFLNLSYFYKAIK